MSLVDTFADFVGDVSYRPVTLPWGETQVWEVGTGDPIVLLHGISASRRIFFRLVPLLAERRRVIVAPLRGEDAPVPYVRLDPLLDDIAALLDALAIDGVTLFGTSFGGYLGLAYAARRDPRVRALVVQGAFPRFRLRRFDRVALALSRLFPDDWVSRYFASRVRRGAEAELLARQAPGLDVLLADWSEKTPAPTLRARTLLIGRDDISNDVRRIDVPVTLAHGRRDKVVPFGYFEMLRALRPDARCEVLEEAGHLVALSDPSALARLCG